MDKPKKYYTAESCYSMTVADLAALSVKAADIGDWVWALYIAAELEKESPKQCKVAPE